MQVLLLIILMYNIKLIVNWQNANTKNAGEAVSPGSPETSMQHQLQAR